MKLVSTDLINCIKFVMDGYHLFPNTFSKLIEGFGVVPSRLLPVKSAMRLNGPTLLFLNEHLLRTVNTAHTTREMEFRKMWVVWESTRIKLYTYFGL